MHADVQPHGSVQIPVRTASVLLSTNCGNIIMSRRSCACAVRVRRSGDDECSRAPADAAMHSSQHMARQTHRPHLELLRCRVHVLNLNALKVQCHILSFYVVEPNINQFKGPVVADQRINTGIRRCRSTVRCQVELRIACAAITDVLAIRQCTEGREKTCDRGQPTAMPAQAKQTNKL